MDTTASELLSTKPLLRPGQAQEVREEIDRIDATVGADAPPHVRRAVKNAGQMRKQRNTLARMLETQAPRPLSEKEKDAAVKLERQLREKFTVGMPTQAEMRLNPSGAVGKHMAWEKRNKAAIMAWKNLRLRLHASGDAEFSGYDGDIANIENYRPKGGAQELNLDTAQIARKDFHGLGNTGVTVLTDEDIALLTRALPEIADKLGLMTNEQRAAVKDALKNSGVGDKPRGLETMPFSELRQHCKAVGLSAHGTKTQLIERLMGKAPEQQAA